MFTGDLTSILNDQNKLSQLAKLRSLYLDSDARSLGKDYWESAELLALYDQTLARRIAWKIEAVLSELRARNRLVLPQSLLDWGCGSGVGAEVILRECEKQARLPATVFLWDRSELAMSYAQKKLQSMFPSVEFALWSAEFSEKVDFVLVSHVLNEMSELKVLLNRLAVFKHILWVENGTHQTSRKLGGCRNDLLKMGFQALAPCTHQASCPVLNRDEDWCHFFAKIPQELYHDGNWQKLFRDLKIDFHKLPFSFIFLEKSAQAPDEEAWSRSLGSPREYKGFLKILDCHGHRGVSEVELPKRIDPKLFKEIAKHSPQSFLAKWELADEADPRNRVARGEVLKL